MILLVHEFHASKRLLRTVRSGPFHLQIDTAFPDVIRACAEPRPGQDGTWITEEMILAYCELHRLGHAHSVECWQDGKLVGGLYGLLIGHMFFGESMFARVTDASKVALVHLIGWLMERHVPIIDCQQETRHLASFGARPIPRAQFVQIVTKLTG